MHFIKDQRITMRQFYADSGISRGTLESATGITEDTLAKFFAHFPEADANWIVFGKREIKPAEVTPLINDIQATYGQCLLCKEKERMINLLEAQLANSLTEIERLHNIISDLSQQIAEADSRKRNSA